MKKIFLILTLFCTWLYSCDNFLDVQPKGQLVPTSTDDFELLLNDPALMEASEYNVLQYFSDDAYWPDMLIAVLKQLPFLYNSYTWQKDIYSPTEDDAMWSGSYSRIFTYNSVIQRIMDSKGGSAERKAAICAEALLGRAVEYFYLVNTYGPAYSQATADTPAVPLVLTDDATAKLDRSTVGQVYARIIDDLVEAEKVLPDTPKLIKYRGSKAGARAMLSRIGLYMGDWEMAAGYADRVLAQHNTLLDYNNFRVLDDTKGIGRTDLPRLTDNPEAFYVRQFSYPFGVSGLVWASDDLAAMYAEGDRRFQLYFTNYFSMMGMELPWHNYSAFYELCITPAVPEMLLTRAEACARMGGADNLAKALNDLNTLRRNRIAPEHYADLSSSDRDEVLRWVLDERRRELVFMGLRLYDQKRLNLDPATATDLTRVVEGETLSLPANSPLYIMTIWPKVADYHPEWFE